MKKRYTISAGIFNISQQEISACGKLVEYVKNMKNHCRQTVDNALTVGRLSRPVLAYTAPRHPGKKSDP